MMNNIGTLYTYELKRLQAETCMDCWHDYDCSVYVFKCK